MPIEALTLSKEYKRQNSAFYAVREVSLTIRPGDFVSIIGRSGSGKSTLLNMIAGLLMPTSGSILVEGRNMEEWNDEKQSLYRNSAIGYIPQGHSLLSNLTVLDNVRVPFHFFSKHGNSDVPALSLLQKVGIEHLADAYPRHLSGGELKRVAIARALINRPDYLLADEPTGELDVQTTEEIVKLLKEISEGGTAVLMVTHELDALDYGTRAYSMSAGILTEYSPVKI